MNLTVLLAICCGLFGTDTASVKQSPLIRGDYIEARTASVFAGACHYNGELMTSGRDAICAFHITSGSYNHVDLSGVCAVVVVTSDANLGDPTAARSCEIMIDSSASSAQSAAMVEAIKSHYASTLGQIVSVHSGPVSFAHHDRQYHVDAGGFASLTAQGMPNDECCKQPNMVWYSPLVHLEGRKVGYVTSAQYTAGTLTDPWQRADENSAFYGSLSF